MVIAAERTIEAQIRSASRIESERLPHLKLLGDAWANAGVAALRFCASPVAIECIGISNLAYTATAPLAKQATVCGMLKSAKWREAGFVLGDALLADIFAEAMFGGSGSSAAGRSANAPRPMTMLDRRLAEKGLATLIEAGNPVFDAVAPLDIVLDRTVFASVADELDERLAADNRSFLVLAFRLAVGQVASTVHVALPEKALAPHRRKLSTLPEKAEPPSDETWAKNIQEGLQRADLEIRALLDERQITLGEVAQFAVGQTIVLDATMESLIVIECENQRLFRGRMGMSRDAYVVRIEDKIDPTEEFIDDILAD